jgi:hypothetical protein
VSVGVQPDNGDNDNGDNGGDHGSHHLPNEKLQPFLLSFQHIFAKNSFNSTYIV